MLQPDQIGVNFLSIPFIQPTDLLFDLQHAHHHLIIYDFPLGKSGVGGATRQLKLGVEVEAPSGRGLVWFLTTDKHRFTRILKTEKPVDWFGFT